MSDERIDPETLAAFLEGRVSPEEREGVLRTLARSREAYASFLEASAIYREIADSAAVPTAASPDRLVAAPTAPAGQSARDAAKARWSRRGRLAPLLIAAGFAVILISREGTRRKTIGDAVQLAQATSLTTSRGSGTLTRTFGETWDQPPWSVVRGRETTFTDRALGVRAGVRFAELEAAAQAADSTAAARSAEAIAQLLSGTEGAVPIAATFHDLGQAPDFGGRSGRATSAGQLRSLLDAPEWFDLGVWLETARLAVAAGDTAFFAPGSRANAALQRLVGSHATAAADAEWTNVVEALGPLRPPRIRTGNAMSEVGRAIDAAIAVAAR